MERVDIHDTRVQTGTNDTNGCIRVHALTDQGRMDMFVCQHMCKRLCLANQTVSPICVGLAVSGHPVN